MRATPACQPRRQHRCQVQSVAVAVRTRVPLTPGAWIAMVAVIPPGIDEWGILRRLEDTATAALVRSRRPTMILP
jgi:hypothetical protein